MPRNKYPEETRQAILDAALKLFLEKGYEKTTILDIVNGMDGLTRGAFYHHFKSKEEVMDQISEDLFYANNPFEKVQNTEGLNGLEKLRKAVFNTDLDGYSDEQIVLAKEMAALTASPQMLAKQFDFSHRIAVEYVAPLMEEGMADGSIAPNNPRWLAELLLTFLNVWVGFNIPPSDENEFVGKLVFMADVFDKLGCPVFDEEAEKAAEIAVDMYFPDADKDALRKQLEEGVDNMPDMNKST